MKRLTHETLDTPINELFPSASNQETTRHFIRKTEREFELEEKDLEAMTVRQLNRYVDYLDELWLK